MYGKRKAIAKRTPLVLTGSKSLSLVNGVAEPSTNTALTPTRAEIELDTPAATEGDTATETELETDEDVDGDISPASPPNGKAHVKSTRHRTQPSNASSISNHDVPMKSLEPRTEVRTQHDLLNKYFRRDAVVLRHVDLLRYRFFFINHCRIWLM